MSEAPARKTRAPTYRLAMRSKELVALVSGLAVLIIFAAVSTYFLAFRSLPTTVSWAPSVSAIAPGGDLTLSGKVSPAESGRHVSFESAPKTQGPWQPMSQAATTDINGLFTITFTPQFAGSIVMRAMVDPAGRYLAVTGVSKPLSLLSLSSIILNGGGTIPTQVPLKFSLVVSPPSVARTVQMEQSSDKVRWVPVGPSARTKTDGSASISMPSPAVGVWSYRARVIQDDKFGGAVSPIVGVTVEDIKAAAATYLRVINVWNASQRTFSTAADRANASTDVLGNLRSAALVSSAADTSAAAQLRAYGSWPQSVRSLIDQIINQFVVSADSDHQLSAAPDLASWNTLMTQENVATTPGEGLATLIRQALGLPQRPTS